jgi:hypothetical protein
MEKNKLTRFISKYALGSLVESVKWQASNGVLSTSFVSDDKSVLGNVQFKDFNQSDFVVGVYDTSKLSKLLNVLGDDIDISTLSIDGRIYAFRMKDSSTKLDYMLADLQVIPAVPDLKTLPAFDIVINLDNNFVTKFIKAKSALNDESSFTVVKNGDKAQIVLGYTTNSSSTNIAIDVDCATELDTFKPLSFSASYFKEILNANRESKNAVLNISTQGISHIHFESDEYVSDYYLVQVIN